MTRKLQVGDWLPEEKFGPLELADFVRYAGASGDMNPLHFDRTAAQSAGYPSVFSQGMLQAGLLATSLTNWFPAESVRRFQVRFLAQVWPGDVLTCTGAVEQILGESRVLMLTLSATRQTGEIAVSGSADVELPLE